MTEAASRPVPPANIYVPSDVFWNEGKKGKLVLQFCADTNQFQHPPHPLSVYTGSQNVEWRPVSGKGTIYALTIVRLPGPGMAGRLPLTIATVELAEGVRIIANILESAAEAIRIGAPVTLTWDKLDNDTPYPAFRVEGAGV